MYSTLPKVSRAFTNVSSFSPRAGAIQRQKLVCMAAATQERVKAPKGYNVSYPQQNLINGKWVSAQSGKTFDVFDPSTGSVIAKVPDSEKADVDAAVESSRRAFDHGPWQRMPPSQRGRIIHKIGDLIYENLEELAVLESLDNGKPVNIARTNDVPLAANMFHYMSGWADKITGDNIPLSNMPDNKYLCYTIKEPKGVVGQIIPWNFPLLMAAWKLTPALAGGNCSILKPAEQTPLTALRLGELMLEAGLPEGVVNIINGPGERSGPPLVTHDKVDKVAFTGSTGVGKILVNQCTSNLKRLTLELGGKSPNIILEDADIEKAIKGAAQAVYYNQGQVCNAGTRLFIHRSIYEEVLAGVAEETKKIRVGRGIDTSTDMGPLVSAEQRDRVYSYIQSGQEQGARLMAGGNKMSQEGYFLEPTLFADVKNNMKIYQEEIFGPVISALPFDSWDELIPEANNSVYGLAAGIWTKDAARAHSLARHIKAGTVWVNCYNCFDAAAPFGGFKQSGWGREMGREVIDAYTETKTIWVDLHHNQNP